ncbi:MAG: hypothetical protein Kow00121_44980 [Elainellaceae cyanobacterium]
MRHKIIAFTLLAGFGLEVVGCSQLPNLAASDRPSPVEATPAAQDIASLVDPSILPGERVGSVTSTTSYPDLVEQFGSDRLSDHPFHMGEGQFAPATRVELGERSFTVIWEDDSRSKAVAVSEFGTDWSTPEGIGIGTSLAELELILGSFRLYGFGWDYAGTVILNDTPLSAYQGSLFLRLSPDATASETQSDHFQAVQGDSSFESSNSHMQALNPQVNQMLVRLAP